MIAAFEDGTAVMIKSLNHTLPSYQQKWQPMEKAVLKMIDTLEAFQGAEYGGISIRKEDIKRKS